MSVLFVFSESYLSLFLAPLKVFLLSSGRSFAAILSEWLVLEYLPSGESAGFWGGVENCEEI